MLKSEAHLATESNNAIELKAAVTNATLLVRNEQQKEKRLDQTQSDLVASQAAAYKTLEDIDQQEEQDSAAGVSTAQDKIEAASADRDALKNAVGDLRKKVQQSKTKQARLKQRLAHVLEDQKSEIESEIRLAASEGAALEARLDHEKTALTQASARLTNATMFADRMKQVEISTSKVVKDDEARAAAVKASEGASNPVENSKIKTAGTKINEQIREAQNEQRELESLSKQSKQILEDAKEEGEQHAKRDEILGNDIEATQQKLADDAKEKVKQAAAVEAEQATLEVPHD